MIEYSSVERLSCALEETNVEAQTYFDLNSQTLTDLAESPRDEVAPLRAPHDALLVDEQHLKASFDELSATHKKLMAPSLAQTEQTLDLRSTLPEPILRFLHQLLQTLPTDFDEELTPDDKFYNFLCCSPQADSATISSNSKLLLKCLHPGLSSTPEVTLVQSVGLLVPLLTLIKCNLNSPHIRRV